jgi:hypothetical protein
MISTMDQFKQTELQWIENTPEELEAVTIEMLERTGSSGLVRMSKSERQKQFRVEAKESGQKYGIHAAEAFGEISDSFLERHPKLFGR